MPQESQPEINTNVPHSARVYDYWLGGKDNFPADRRVAKQIAEQAPLIRAMARSNREFMGRAVRYLVGEAGMRQFLDVGTGIPTSPNVHEVAQAIAPETRVLYVDNDPIVLAHARALMTSHEAGATAFILADVRQPETILTDPALRATLDLSQPVALTVLGVMHLVRDDEDPYGKVAALVDALPPSSYLALTHPTADGFDPDTVSTGVAASAQSGFPLTPRTHTEVERFFTGLDLLAPGLVPGMAWRPDNGLLTTPPLPYFWAGVARKP